MMRIVRFILIGFASIIVAFGKTDLQSLGENLLIGVPEWTSANGKSFDSQLSAPTNGAVFIKTVSVEPEQEYFFAVTVKSEDRFVATLGGLSMSYHTQGEWQRVCGLVRSNKNTSLEIKLDLRSLESNRSALAEIKDLVLQRVGRPKKIELRTYSGETSFVVNGNDTAVIIYPEKSGKSWAEKIQNAIQTKTGVELPILSDCDATESTWPILHPELKNKHLILIGNLDTNRALWAAYNRFLAAEDAYYPGGDGFTVRTAANVFGNGKNHLILGGSSKKGVERAVEKFLDILNHSSEGKSLTLPWLLEVELGGECKSVFAEDNTLWNSPEDTRLPAQTSGYGKVTRWYQNAMGYYWSGLPQYREREKVNRETILSEHSNTHQYIVEFLVRTYDMLNESPLFDAVQNEKMSTLILDNFLNFLTVTDLNWMTVFSPPYSKIKITNRHQLAPWYADLLMARFLRNNVESEGMLHDLIEFRFSEKETAFRSFVASRNGPSLPGIAAGSDYEEFPATFFRYALENELYEEFIGSGLAHQALTLDRLNVSGARLIFPPCDIDLGMWLGAMAQLTGDARYQWLEKNIPFLPSDFQSRYIAGVHRYKPAANLPAREPVEWTGIQVGAQPHKEDQTLENDTKHFPHITMRGGFNPEDDSLMVAGITRDYAPGTLIHLTANKITFLGGTTGSRSTSNSASVVRLDKFQINSPQPPNNAGLLWKRHNSRYWAFETTTTLSNEIEWFRTTIRLDNGRYLFRDIFKAQQEGSYLLQINWRTNYTFHKHIKKWEIVTNRGNLQLEKIGENFTDRQTDPSQVTWESVREMKAGDTVVVWTLAQSQQPLSLNQICEILADDFIIEDSLGLVNDSRPSFLDKTKDWFIRWNYDGLLRPILLKPKIISEDIVDFGKVVKLTEIRSTYSGRFWKTTTLPNDIFAAASNNDWTRIDTPHVARPGMRTGNYGEAEPLESVDESMFPKNLQARFIKTKGAANLQYFGSDILASRHPIHLKLLTELPDGKPRLLAQNGRFPAFPRPWRDDDFSLALLQPENGKALAQIDIAGPVQGVLVADQKGKGEAEIFVLRKDARIDTFSLDGKPRESIDLYAQSLVFQKRFGKGNTRHPAGGHYMPFSFGLWRPNSQGAQKWVIGRYGSILFLDENKKLEGVLNFPSYASPAMLSSTGIDFNKDGREEMLMLERFNLIHIDGDPIPKILEPNGTQFWPQVYERSVSAPKDAGTNLLSGAPVYAFQALKKFNGELRYVFVARENYIGLYDAIERKWILSWRPPAPISAATVLRETEHRLELCLTTVDGLFWTTTMDSRRSERVIVSVHSLPLSITEMQSNSEEVILAAQEGLYLYSRESTFSKIADGSFASAAFINSNQIVAADKQGRVVSFFKNRDN